MQKAPAAAFLLLVVGTGAGHACQLEVLGSPPTWEQKIDVAETIFVGRVVRLKPNSKPGEGDAKAVLRVDEKIRGALGRYFEALQGNGGDCGITFRVGDRVIFAGDAIWDPTVFLSPALSAEQQTQLEYVKEIAESR